MFVYILLAIVSILVIIVVRLNPRKRASGNLPPVYAPYPLLGCGVEYGKNPITLLKKLHEKLGDCFTLHLMGNNMTYLIGPEAQAVFFKSTDEELSLKEAYRFVVPVFGKGVVYDSPPSVFVEQLKFVKNGLAANQLKKNVTMMELEAVNFFLRWGEKGEFDLLDQMNNLTMLTASRCLLGKEIRESPEVQTDFARLYHDLEGGLNPIAFFFPNLPLPAHLKRDKARVEVQALFSKIIKQRKQNVDPNNKPEDMLQILMESEYKSGDVVDDHAITGLLLALLFAGQHTSGITATWTGFFLYTHRQFLDEVIEEQKQIKTEFGETISFDSLKKSVKLENCVRETLRLLPPLIILMRKVARPLKFREYDLPVGDFLCIAPGYGNRVAEVYPNPDTFDPHRFERGEHNAVPYAYLSFGGGRHGCPGENFGILQVKTIWTVLLRSFEFEVPGKMPVPDYTNLVVGPAQPSLIRYKRRSNPL